jgi:hypothetical protein
MASLLPVIVSLWGIIVNSANNVSWHTALSRLKLTIAASATLCCHLLARYRANPESFWYTLVCDDENAMLKPYNHHQQLWVWIWLGVISNELIVPYDLHMFMEKCTINFYKIHFHLFHMMCHLGWELSFGSYMMMLQLIMQKTAEWNLQSSVDWIWSPSA